MVFNSKKYDPVINMEELNKLAFNKEMDKNLAEFITTSISHIPGTIGFWKSQRKNLITMFW